MRRAERFEDLFERYEDREYKKEDNNEGMSLADIRQRLSKGFEDKYRVGLLVGTIKANTDACIRDVVVPAQDSDAVKSVVLNWAPAIHAARLQGNIIGIAVYVGHNLPPATALGNATLKTHECLCRDYGIGGLIMSLNEQDCAIRYQLGL